MNENTEPSYLPHFSSPHKNAEAPYALFQSEFATFQDAASHPSNGIVPGTHLNLVGLALSGGGIRSAAFNLGFLQALYQEGLFDRIHYLSTVSGGGFIGGCLTTLLNSRILAKERFSSHDRFPFKTLGDNGQAPVSTPEKASKEVADCLETESGDKSGSAAETVRPMAENIYGRPVEQLRFNSNYITPPGNLIDKYVRPAMVFVRGMALNFLTVVPYLLAVAIALSFLLTLRSNFNWNNFWVDNLLFDMPTLEKALNDKEMEAAWIEPWVYVVKQPGHLPGTAVLTTSDAGYAASSGNMEGAWGGLHDALRSVWLLPLLLFGATLLLALTYCCPKFVDFDKRFANSKILGHLLLASLALLLINLYGMAIVYTKYWEVPAELGFVSLLSLLMPKLLGALDGEGDGPKKRWAKKAVAYVLLAIVPFTLLFLIGIAIDYLAFAELDLFHFLERLDLVRHFDSPAGIETYLKAHPLLPKYGILAAVALGCFLLGVFVIDVNRISLHNFYRDRLSRAFLFQAGGDRKKGPFSRIWHRDSLRLSDLKADRPYHLINVNLNLSKGTPFGKTKPARGFDLYHGKHERNLRNGENFILSRNWCGSEKTGYEGTRRYEGRDRHLDLGTAMAISGGAASVGMGLMNRPSLRLLMGLLNIRLGYWAPRPGAGKRDLERFSTWPLNAFHKHRASLYEWFFGYRNDAPYINLSDGGHFENLGVYELLRRRCKYILVGDAEADDGSRFPGLSNLVRLARIDFGIEIDINVSGIKPDADSGLSGNHCAVGTIHYPAVDGLQEETGYLLYCKSSLSGDEPQDLRGYKDAHGAFPHESTADQWFDVQQFEVYRKLGHHVGRDAFTPCLAFTQERSLEDTFKILQWFWRPPTSGESEVSAQCRNKLKAIVAYFKNIHHAPTAAVALDKKAEPLSETARSKVVSRHRLKRTPRRRDGQAQRQCRSMLNLLENIYREANLKRTRLCSESEGVMLFVKQWFALPIFRDALSMCAADTTKDFNAFCNSLMGKECRLRTIDEPTAPKQSLKKSIAELMPNWIEKIHYSWHCRRTGRQTLR